MHVNKIRSQFVDCFSSQIFFSKIAFLNFNPVATSGREDWEITIVYQLDRLSIILLKINFNHLNNLKQNFYEVILVNNDSKKAWSSWNKAKAFIE